MPYDVEGRPPATQLIMVEGEMMAKKGIATPPWYRAAARRANRSKRKAIYFVAGPALIIATSAAGGPIGLGVGIGVVVGAVASAVVGYVGYKIWRNARQAYSRRAGMKNFRLKLAEVGGLHVGVKADISANVINRVRYFIQKGSLGTLTDDFKYLVDKQIELSREAKKPLVNCRDAMHLANLLYTVDHRRKGLMMDLIDFQTFYQWVIIEMERCRALLSTANLRLILEQIGGQADNGSAAAHQRCQRCCYRKVNGKVTNPAISTMKYRSAAWKHDPALRLMNDAMNMAYIGLHKSDVAYFDYQEEFKRLFNDIYIFDAQPSHGISDYGRVDTPHSVFDRAKKMAKGVTQGAGRAGAAGETLAGVKGATYALHVPLTQVTGALLPQTATQAVAGGGLAAVGAVGGAATRTVGELINTSYELSRVKTPLQPSSAWQMIKEKSSRLDSLRAVLKAGTFETAIDHFIKLRQRVEELEKVVGSNANVRIRDCPNAVAAAFNMLNAIKHWQAMTEPMRLVKEYAEILEAQSMLHQDFLEYESKIMDRVDDLVARHDLSFNRGPCWKYCKCVAVPVDD